MPGNVEAALTYMKYMECKPDINSEPQKCGLREESQGTIININFLPTGLAILYAPWTGVTSGFKSQWY